MSGLERRMEQVFWLLVGNLATLCLGLAGGFVSIAVSLVVYYATGGP